MDSFSSRHAASRVPQSTTTHWTRLGLMLALMLMTSFWTQSLWAAETAANDLEPVLLLEIAYYTPFSILGLVILIECFGRSRGAAFLLSFSVIFLAAPILFFMTLFVHGWSDAWYAVWLIIRNAFLAYGALVLCLFPLALISRRL